MTEGSGLKTPSRPAPDSPETFPGGEDRARISSPPREQSKWWEVSSTTSDEVGGAERSEDGKAANVRAR
jgi:hypothetical protein